ncbi:Cna B-type domain-containing protein [Propionibacterium australiense]|uniref:Cna B-type domain-containing protein n=1 Tax=Propionibacterium australiense TaxID=119981 RepID=A0A8B3FMM7_9ACTN|nr:Cna B-type domain-containing protein [Propionibacterium australiense]
MSAVLAFGIVAPGGATTATAQHAPAPAQVLQQGSSAGDSDQDSAPQPRATVFDAVTVTVNDEAGLLAAIAAATDGDVTTIRLAGDIALTGTVTIPAGKIITITNADGDSPTVTSSAKPFFQVETGGTFTLSGDVTLDGQGRNNCFVTTAGSFILDGATLRNLLASRQGFYDENVGAVIVTGGDATFTMASGLITDTTVDRDHGAAVYVRDGASATMSGGTITNTTINNQYAGSVVVDGGTFTMEGGEISNGDAGNQIQTSGGVLVLALNRNGATPDNAIESTFTMNGGTITNCSAPRGGGVYLYGGSAGVSDWWSKAHFTMNGGEISNCQATGLTMADGSVSDGAGGGVYVESGSDFVMNDGTITGNTATGMGGGVATYDTFVNYFGKIPYEDGFAQWPSYFPASFTMNGGTISGNSAQAGQTEDGDRGCGGGVYSASSEVRINAGLIENNTASKQGGGLYVGSVPYSLYINDSLITDNEASVLGGGVWFCPTGEASINVNSGTALYGNSAQGAGDDVSIVRLPDNEEQMTATISDRMLGGGLADWHRDGAALEADANDALGVPDPDVARYSADTADETAVSGITDDPASYQLKATPSDQAVQLSSGLAKVIVRNNSSTRGGGIGSNGKVVLGNEHEYTESLTVTKQWDPGQTGLSTPENITVWLTIDGYRVESVVLDESNEWTHTFEGLPLDSGATIEEDAPEGWTADYQREYYPDTREITVVVLNEAIEVTPEPTPDVTPTPDATPTAPTETSTPTPGTPSKTRPAKMPRTGEDAFAGLFGAVALVAACAGAQTLRKRKQS